MSKDTYEIRTITDIFRAVNRDNVERLMMDIYKSLDIYAEAKEKMTQEEIDSVKEIVFTWKDDGKNNITFDFDPTDDNKQ